jgi:O-acetyl-ADP-ribose deacetylase (regulator of RNase III)
MNRWPQRILRQRFVFTYRSSLKLGQAVITSGCDLPAKSIIHTPGPIWRGHNATQLLRNCCLNSLALPLKHKCQSAAFPVISSGIYGYPKRRLRQR